MLESLVIMLKAAKRLQHRYFPVIGTILKNNYVQKYLLTIVSDFPNPTYPFVFIWQILSISIPTASKLGLFFNGATLFSQIHPSCIS